MDNFNTLLVKQDPKLSPSSSTITGTDLKSGTPRHTLASVRASLRHVARDLAILEGRFLDFTVADEMQRTLDHLSRQLEGVTLQVSVLERRAAHNG